MPWTDAEIVAVGSAGAAIVTCVVTAVITLRKDRRLDDGTTIGQWRQIVRDKDRAVDRLERELAAERLANNGCQVEKATLKSENRHLKEMLGMGPDEPTPPETPWLPGNPDRRRPQPKSGKHYTGPERREPAPDETEESDQ